MKNEPHYFLDIKGSFFHPFEMFVIFVIGAILLSVLINLFKETANNKNTTQIHQPGSADIPSQDTNYSISVHAEGGAWWDTSGNSHSTSHDSSYSDSSSSSSDSSSSSSSSSDSSSSSSSSD